MSKPELVASCAASEPRERNRATEEGRSATGNATRAQPGGIKALAGAVLERNRQRNPSATSELRGSIASATKAAKLGADLRVEGKPESTSEELARLVSRVYATDTPEDRAEALEHALRHPEEALTCYRWILSPDYIEYQKKRTLH